MTSYTSLALLYDALMAEVDYSAWAGYLHSAIKHFGAPGLRLLDLACGTGTLTVALQARGYQPTGIDLSPDMLAIAANKGFEVGLGIDSWLAMDMRALKLLPASFDIAVCACDGFNYLLSNHDFEATLSGLRQALRPGGLLLFDTHTEYKMRHVFQEGPFVQESEAGYCIWSSQFDDCTGNATHDMTLFIPEKEELWRRHEESHHQHYFAPVVIKNALAAQGFDLLDVVPWGQLTGEAAATTERLQYIARRQTD